MVESVWKKLSIKQLMWPRFETPQRFFDVIATLDTR